MLSARLLNQMFEEEEEQSNLDKKDEHSANMDFARLTELLNSKSYDKIADICDELMIQAAAEGISYQDQWPYTIHFLGYFYVDDINSARFLWKSIPSTLKENQPELVAIWKIGQKLWVQDHGGVYEAIHGFEWSQEVQGLLAAFADLYRRRMFQLLMSAYSTISIHDTAHFLGMNEEEAKNYVTQQGWIVDLASQMFTVKKQQILIQQKLGSSTLQRLTEYVLHLEH